MERQNQGGGTGGYSGGQQGKGISSFFSNPDQIKMVAREGYIQQAGLKDADAVAVRRGDWDGKIPGFELTTHTLQNADQLLQTVVQGA